MGVAKLKTLSGVAFFRNLNRLKSKCHVFWKVKKAEKTGRTNS
jgi:hypothetical protein